MLNVLLYRNIQRKCFNDQLIANYYVVKKSEMIEETSNTHFMVNAFILNKKYNVKKLDHYEYSEYIAEYLIQTPLLGNTTNLPSRTPIIEIDCMNTTSHLIFILNLYINLCCGLLL